MEELGSGVHLVHNRLEAIGIVEGKISKNLPVEDDIVLVELVDKPGIIDSKRSYSCIDPGDPKSAESTFLLPSVNKGVFHGALHGVFGNRVHF